MFRPRDFMIRLDLEYFKKNIQTAFVPFSTMHNGIYNFKIGKLRF
jgi:hypothetical protein